jgi:hypothetical protein
MDSVGHIMYAYGHSGTTGPVEVAADRTGCRVRTDQALYTFTTDQPHTPLCIPATQEHERTPKALQKYFAELGVYCLWWHLRLEYGNH